MYFLSESNRLILLASKSITISFPSGKKVRYPMDKNSPGPSPFLPIVCMYSKGWAEMIRKVYEVDPLCCPSCGGQMRVISFIEEPKVIDKIIHHLKLTFEAQRPPPHHFVQQEL